MYLLSTKDTKASKITFVNAVSCFLLLKGFNSIAVYRKIYYICKRNHKTGEIMTESSIHEIEEMSGAKYSLFDQAEISRFSPKELQAYEDSLKVYRDLKNVLDTAELKGLRKGIAQGALDEKRKNAKTMKALGLPLDTISKVTGLSVAEIEKLV